MGTIIFTCKNGINRVLGDPRLNRHASLHELINELVCYGHTNSHKRAIIPILALFAKHNKGTISDKDFNAIIEAIHRQTKKGGLAYVAYEALKIASPNFQ